MFKCHDCRSEESHTEYVSEIFNIDSKFYLVENIPAEVCSRCGQEIFSAETAEQIRLMLHGEKRLQSRLALTSFRTKKCHRTNNFCRN